MSNYYAKYMKYKLKNDTMNGSALSTLINTAAPHVKTIITGLQAATPHALAAIDGFDMLSSMTKERYDISRKKALEIITQTKTEVTGKKEQLQKVLGSDYEKLVKILDDITKYLNEDSLSKFLTHKSELAKAAKDLIDIIKKIPKGTMSENLQKLDDMIKLVK